MKHHTAANTKRGRRQGSSWKPSRTFRPLDSPGNTYALVSDGSWGDDGPGEKDGDHSDDTDKTAVMSCEETSQGDDPPQSSSSSSLSLSCTSNEALLSTAFLSFMAFTILQTAAAFVAQSEAMMGDSAAMFVDALTYAFNLYAERRKNQAAALPLPQRADYDSKQHYQKALQELDRCKRLSKLRMELIPPLVSVVTLLIVIVIVLQQAFRVLLLDAHRSVEEQAKPNLILMLCFSSLNLTLDILNVFCFARAKHACGFQTEASDEGDEEEEEEESAVSKAERGQEKSNSLTDPQIQDTEMESLNSHSDNTSMEGKLTPEPSSRNDTNAKKVPVRTNEQTANHGRDDESTNSEDLPLTTKEPASLQHDHSRGAENKANLNMCSAYTHVFADTLRSIAVVVAAVTAEISTDLTPEEADASAAIVVSIVIVLSLIPLLNGLRHTWRALRRVHAEIGVACVKSEMELKCLEKSAAQHVCDSSLCRA